MKKNVAILSMTAAAVFGLCSMAFALPFTSKVANDDYAIKQGGVNNGIPTANDDNDGIPDINDAINKLLGTSYARNTDVDDRFVSNDELWELVDKKNGRNETGMVALIGLTASYKNTLGIYNHVGDSIVKTSLLGPYSGFGFLGNGTKNNPYPGVQILPNTPEPFGWYLNVNGGTNYYSEASLNAGGFDHMMTFALPELKDAAIWVAVNGKSTKMKFKSDAYLLAWEDLPYSNGRLGDEDYDDMMYVVGRLEVAATPEPSTVLLLGLGIAGLGIVRARRMKK